MILARLGHSGGLGAHVPGDSLRMDKAVLWPRCGAVPIYRTVDRQPLLLCGCRQINYWQYRISQTPTGPAAKKAILARVVAYPTNSHSDESESQTHASLTNHSCLARQCGQ